MTGGLAKAVFISPEGATNILKKSKRVWLSQPRIERYAEMMKKGEWDIKKEEVPIILSKNGGIINGHHRMRAVIKSGKGSWFNVEKR
jgi:hypothetical protein